MTLCKQKPNVTFIFSVKEAKYYRTDLDMTKNMNMWTYSLTSNPIKKKSSHALVYYKSTTVRSFVLHMSLFKFRVNKGILTCLLTFTINSMIDNIND